MVQQVRTESMTEGSIHSEIDVLVLIRNQKFCSSIVL